MPFSYKRIAEKLVNEHIAMSSNRAESISEPESLFPLIAVHEYRSMEAPMQYPITTNIYSITTYKVYMYVCV